MTTGSHLVGAVVAVPGLLVAVNVAVWVPVVAAVPVINCATA